MLTLWRSDIHALRSNRSYQIAMLAMLCSGVMHAVRYLRHEDFRGNTYSVVAMWVIVVAVVFVLRSTDDVDTRFRRLLFGVIVMSCAASLVGLLSVFFM